MFNDKYLQGTAFGKRTFNYIGKAVAYDFVNGYYCEMSFEANNDWFSKKKTSKDYFR